MASNRNSRSELPKKLRLSNHTKVIEAGNITCRQSHSKSFRFSDDLRRLISLERIARGSDRSTAHIENGSVKIVRRVGKWNLFGSGNHLQWHEALYLMEMVRRIRAHHKFSRLISCLLQNRLEVYFDSMVVSLERAYSLFLRKSTDASDCGKLSRAEYAVYSHFMREGYIVQAHSPESQGESSRISTKSDKSNQTNPDTQTQQCIWKYLFELLGQQQHAMQRADVDSETYERVKRSMDNTISKFKPQDVLRDSVPRKRKHDDGETSSGGLHHSNHDFGSGRLNAFMIGDERTTFKRVFDEIDIIHLNANDSTENDPSNGTLNFSFDLWTDGVFKKTEIPDPHYRIAVLR